AASGCASYREKPLEAGAATATTPLYVDAAAMPLPALRQHRFDPTDGLDQTEVAMLAVANNPELRLLRDDLGIQRAQAFAARLLPDPQLSFGQDFPVRSGPDLVTAFTAGITQDITALLMRSSTMQASRLDTRKIELDELWAEWQMVAQARALFNQVQADTRLLHELQTLLPDHERLREAVQSELQAGNLTSDVAAGPLLALADLQRQIDDTAQKLNLERHTLQLLLGLDEHAELRLVDDAEPTQAEQLLPAGIDQRLAALPERRPDLLALRIGYQAQEVKLRQAVLKQFPSISLGLSRARDTSNITTRGYSIGLTLPLFDRGRGAIAIETATRQRLFDEYQSRLATARSEVDRIRIDLPELIRRTQQAERDAEHLRTLQQAATQSFAGGVLDWNAYVTLSTAAVARRMEAVQLALTLQEQQEMLRTLLGSDLPAPPEAGR
ncbi:TolC family protein, partial [Steroidobacter sp.]|uniref:TolC family protein n=1 Tax=Steroidobacter sp. TaxID=1978227 RepID=UPI001A4F207B